MSKVLLLIPNLGPGGAQIVYLNQLEYLSKHFSVIGCVFNWDGAFESDKRNNIISLNVPAGKNLISKSYYFILRIIRLNKLKENRQIDLCISHLEGADYVNILSKRSDKTVCWIHGTKRHDRNIKGALGFARLKVFIPLLYKRTNRLIAVSKGIAIELASSLAHENIKHIYNGFDTGRIERLASESLDHNFEKLFTDSHVIITHCRLTKQKNLETLIQIFDQVKGFQNIKLLISGDGEMRGQLLDLCDQLLLKTWTSWSAKPFDFSSDVFFVGQQQNPFKFIHRSTLYLMTSDWEGFPLSLCEAMACSVPVIVSDCFTGPREIVAPDTSLPQPVATPVYSDYGILMPLANKNTINLWVNEVDIFLTELNHGVKRYAKGKTRIEEFTLSKTMQQVHDLVNEILA
jgi:glycosyltransferase involved in cell wall biosynthesis